MIWLKSIKCKYGYCVTLIDTLDTLICVSIYIYMLTKYVFFSLLSHKVPAVLQVEEDRTPGLCRGDATLE